MEKLNKIFLAPHVPCPHRAAKTGSWRTYRPIFSVELCNNCELCWAYCPDGVIFRTSSGLKVNLDYCKGCGICAMECRRGAIKMVEEGNDG